ncbi:MAG: hypothetical protein ACI9SY_000244 [Candidatus Paceibacteria bacterium]|jgi:hypothetical protein
MSFEVQQSESQKFWYTVFFTNEVPSLIVGLNEEQVIFRANSAKIAISDGDRNFPVDDHGIISVDSSSPPMGFIPIPEKLGSDEIREEIIGLYEVLCEQ